MPVSTAFSSVRKTPVFLLLNVPPTTKILASPSIGLCNQAAFQRMGTNALTTSNINKKWYLATNQVSSLRATSCHPKKEESDLLKNLMQQKSSKTPVPDSGLFDLGETTWRETDLNGK